ncbi:8443_t:CDS:1, partial [Paraglomus brasilianum]
CLSCPKFNLCSNCKSCFNGLHDPRHKFSEITYARTEEKLHSGVNNQQYRPSTRLLEGSMQPSENKGVAVQNTVETNVKIDKKGKVEVANTVDTNVNVGPWVAFGAIAGVAVLGSIGRSIINSFKPSSKTG